MYEEYATKYTQILKKCEREYRKMFEEYTRKKVEVRALGLA